MGCARSWPQGPLGRLGVEGSRLGIRPVPGAGSDGGAALGIGPRATRVAQHCMLQTQELTCYQMRPVSKFRK